MTNKKPFFAVLEVEFDGGVRRFNFAHERTMLQMATKFKESKALINSELGKTKKVTRIK